MYSQLQQFFELKCKPKHAHHKQGLEDILRDRLCVIGGYYGGSFPTVGGLSLYSVLGMLLRRLHERFILEPINAISFDHAVQS